MNLGEFKSQISGNIRRGNSMDAKIPAFIRQAALWIERNHTLNYMKKLADITINLDTNDTPRFIELQNTRIKSVLWFRWVPDDGEFIWLTPRDPRDFGELETATPRYYFMDGVDRIVLLATPDENLVGELQVARYTDWPAGDASTHWLMTNAEDILEARTMMNFGYHARDPATIEQWRKRLDDSIVGLYAAEQEFTWDNSSISREGY